MDNLIKNGKLAAIITKMSFELLYYTRKLLMLWNFIFLRPQRRFWKNRSEKFLNYLPSHEHELHYFFRAKALKLMPCNFIISPFGISIFLILYKFFQYLISIRNFKTIYHLSFFRKLRL